MRRKMRNRLLEKDKPNKPKNQSNVYWLQERRAVYNAHLTSSSTGSHTWEFRRQAILHIANRCNGLLRVHHVAAECNVSVRTAAEWLQRLSNEKLITVIAWQRKTAIYAVKEVEPGSTQQ